MQPGYETRTRRNGTHRAAANGRSRGVGRHSVAKETTIKIMQIQAGSLQR